mgnify:FL=1
MFNRGHFDAISVGHRRAQIAFDDILERGHNPRFTLGDIGPIENDPGIWGRRMERQRNFDSAVESDPTAGNSIAQRLLMDHLRPPERRCPLRARGKNAYKSTI